MKRNQSQAVEKQAEFAVFARDGGALVMAAHRLRSLRPAGSQNDIEEEETSMLREAV